MVIMPTIWIMMKKALVALYANPFWTAKRKSSISNIIASYMMLNLAPQPALAMAPMIWECSDKLVLASRFTVDQFYAEKWLCNSITRISPAYYICKVINKKSLSSVIEKRSKKDCPTPFSLIPRHRFIFLQN